MYEFNIINLDKRKDRWDTFKEEFSNIENVKLNRFSGIVHNNGWRGCSLSHLEIIKNALIAQGEHGITHVAEKSDIIWLKRQRNSLQDQADIERLEDEKD